GKMVARIRAIDIYTFDNPSVLNAFIRAVVRNFDEMFFYLGMLYAFTNPFVQTMHDKVAKVVVIDE
ncbi:MAG: RDD family protein, partial [Epsilonproteobacteria bacterium]|nr:RDD family protein [Campylobacterota bacterium]